MAQWIRADGTEEQVWPANGSDFTLDEMQEYVGGMIQIVPLPTTGALLVCNEEGKLLDLPFNFLATHEWIKNHGDTDEIVGDVLVCHPGEVR